MEPHFGKVGVIVAPGDVASPQIYLPSPLHPPPALCISMETLVKCRSGHTAPQVKTTRWFLALARLLCLPCLLSVSPSPSWLYAEFPCAMFCYVLCLFHMLPALSTVPPESTLPSQSCSASLPAGEVSDSPKPSFSEVLYATALSLWGALSASASLPCRTLNFKYFIPVVVPWQALI